MPTRICDAYRTLRDQCEPRVQNGIRTFRTAQAEIRLEDADGMPVCGARVRAAQIRHDFLFGANCFMLDGYDSAELNERYKDSFLKLFNAATVPVYWAGMEPEQGNPRFAVNSCKIWRRPPVDLTINWCRKHDLFMNGHTLVWDSKKWQIPKWLPHNMETVKESIARRIQELGERYGHVIQRWDVLNERLHTYGRERPEAHGPMPDGFDIDAFLEAQKAMPPESILMINDYLEVWNPTFRDYHRLIRELEARGARIDTIGLQFHNFELKYLLEIIHECKRFRPDDILQALDGHLTLARPLHISEVSIPQPDDSLKAEEIQAELIRDYFRLWFSHPAVNSITWWNLADGGAAAGEDTVRTGLLNFQLQPKAAYHALDRLINHEWRTETEELISDEHGAVRFRGFKGEYCLDIIHGESQLERCVRLAADGCIKVTVDSGASPC